MSEHSAIQKVSGYIWAVIVVTFGCTLILLSLSSHQPAERGSVAVADQTKPAERSHLAVQSRASGRMEASAAPE